VLLMAIDEPEAAIAAVKRIRERFPNLQVIARAHGRSDAYEYAELGVPAVREVFGSSLDAAFRMLQVLGYEEESAKRVIARFREYDETQLVANAHLRGDITKLIALNEQGRRDIAALLGTEAQQSASGVDRAA
jgi:voltage-gated potassium channel Kch